MSSCQQLPFYLTLPSDASMQVYPNNTAAEWKTRLQCPITLQGQWEVAVVEIIYPNTAYNIPLDQTIEIRQVVSFSAIQPICDVITVPAGIYDADDLIKCIDSQAPKQVNWLANQANRHENNPNPDSTVKFSFVPSERRTRMRLLSNRCTVHFPSTSVHLRNMLGFDKSTLRCIDSPAYVEKLKACLAEDDTIQPLLTQGILDDHLKELEFIQGSRANIIGPRLAGAEIISKKCINTVYGNQTLFVYCDLADYQAVGDSVAPLLRTVPIKGNSAFQMIVEKFDSPHYVKVIRNYIETVEVSLASDLGKNADFKVGKSLVKLHLRKVVMPNA